MRPLSSIHPNPANPRLIRDQEFKDLRTSIEKADWMLALRPILVDETGMILAGDKRYHALKDLGHKEVPEEWIRDVSGLTPEQKQELIIKDNTHFGEWDWTIAPEVWQAASFDGWGVTPDWEDGEPKRTTSRKRLTADGLEAFEILLKPDDKKRLRALMASVKKKNSLDTLADALMHIVSRYPKK